MMIGSCRVYLTDDGKGGMRAFPTKGMAKVARINLEIKKRMSHFKQWLASHELKDSLQNRILYLNTMMDGDATFDLKILKVPASVIPEYVATCFNLAARKEKDGSFGLKMDFDDWGPKEKKA